MLSSLKWRYKPEEMQHCKVGTAEMLLLPSQYKPHWNVSLELRRVSRSCSPGLGAQPGSEQQRLWGCIGPTSALQLSLCSLGSGLLEPGTVSVSVPVLRAGSSLSCLCLFPALPLPWHEPSAGLGPGTATSGVPWLSRQPFLLNLHSPDLSVPPGQCLPVFAPNPGAFIALE